MRERFSDLMTQEGQKCSDFHILTGDHGYALFDQFRRNCGDQFINTGICEQATVGYAAGFAKSGLRPMVYGLAAFIPMRVLEFIKMMVCYENLPVLFIGDGAGLVYSTLGSSHQCGEDIAALRSLPNMHIYSPADEYELELCFKHALAKNAPAYMRVGKSDRPVVHSGTLSSDECVIKVHDAGAKTAIIATGSMVSAAKTIGEDQDIDVWSFPMITEFSNKTYETFFNGYDRIVTIEEHSTLGGIGSIISESIAEYNGRKPVLKRIGLKHQFTSYASTYDVALKEHGLADEDLAAAVKDFIS